MNVTYDTEAIAKEVAAILAAESVRAAVERLLAPKEQKRLTKAVENMRRRTAYVTVIGSQGSGKSSLLNSLLFPIRTLPIGEGVTTNILGFVHCSENEESLRAEVHLKTGETIPIPLTLDSLREYMDEGSNPGNERGVASIHCFARSPLLTQDTAFVDTPGLGSLEQWQDAVTMGFVRDISLAICVIRTTPTLTGSEAKFLRDIWRLCPEILFVQNVWAESEEKVREALAENTRALTEVARQCGDSRPIQLFRVNVHEGLEGVANEDPARAANSGLDSLRAVLYARVFRGGGRLEVEQQGKQVIECLETAIEQGRSLRATASTTNAGEIERLKAAIDEMEDRLSEIKSEQNKRSALFVVKCNEAINSAIDQIETDVNHVRDDFTLTQSDDYVENECANRLKRAIDRAFSTFVRRIETDCEIYLAESSHSLSGIARSLHLKPEDVSINAEISTGIYFGEMTGKLAIWGSNITLVALTGGSAAAFATAMGTGVTVTTAIAAGGAAVPVAGWAVAIVSLSAGMLIKAVAKTKKRAAMREAIHESAQQLIESASKTVSSEGRRVANDISSQVQEIFKAKLEQKEALLQESREALNLSTGKREALMAELEKMIANLTEACRVVGRITQLDEAGG